MMPTKKWLWVGLAVAFLNPIFSGFILGALYVSEPSLRRYGRLVLGFSAVWGAIFFYLVGHLDLAGLPPF